jgi:hypothetical protein
MLVGADAFYVFFGVRFVVQSDVELERLEMGEDVRLTTARRAHLQTCLDRPTDGEKHFLLVGSRIGTFGVEGQASAELTGAEMQRIVETTRQKLSEAGITEEPKFYFQLVAQY